jgi:amidase
MIEEYDELDATALADLVRRGDVHPTELVEAAIERAEARNPALNAIIHRQFERARGDAERVDSAAPFAGVPFLLKDYKGREAGEPYHMGVRTLRELDYRPRSDSDYALAVRAAGLIPIGRTNTPEMAVMGTTEPQLYGPTHNPWALGRSPGGSSGGSASAVAARIVPAAHANDISGSIRIPASLCGLVGLKPTRGRIVTSAGDPPIGMNSEGVVTRSVRDTAALVDALSWRSPWWPAPVLPRPLAAEVGAAGPTLRVGVWTSAFNGSPVDAESARAATDAAALLEAMGHHVEQSAPQVYSSPELWDVAKDALAIAAAAEAAAWEPRIGHALGEADLEPRTWSMVAAGQALTAAQAMETILRMQAFARSAFEWFERFDLLVTPSTAAPASPHGEYLTRYVSGLGSAFTRPFNVTGQPALSLPLGWPDDGLPRGVQLIADHGREDLLIRVAGALESAAPWSHRRPPLDRLAFGRGERGEVPSNS